jgi:hypothetical protein
MGGQAVDVVTPGDDDEKEGDAEPRDSDGDGKKESDAKELTGQATDAAEN